MFRYLIYFLLFLLLTILLFEYVRFSCLEEFISVGNEEKKPFLELLNNSSVYYDITYEPSVPFVNSNKSVLQTAKEENARKIIQDNLERQITDDELLAITERLMNGISESLIIEVLRESKEYYDNETVNPIFLEIFNFYVPSNIAMNNITLAMFVNEEEMRNEFQKIKADINNAFLKSNLGIQDINDIGIDDFHFYVKKWFEESLINDETRFTEYRLINVLNNLEESKLNEAKLIYMKAYEVNGPNFDYSILTVHHNDFQNFVLSKEINLEILDKEHDYNSLKNMRTVFENRFKNLLKTEIKTINLIDINGNMYTKTPIQLHNMIILDNITEDEFENKLKESIEYKTLIFDEVYKEKIDVNGRGNLDITNVVKTIGIPNIENVKVYFNENIQKIEDAFNTVLVRRPSSQEIKTYFDNIIQSGLFNNNVIQTNYASEYGTRVQYEDAYKSNFDFDIRDSEILSNLINNNTPVNNISTTKNLIQSNYENITGCNITKSQLQQYGASIFKDNQDINFVVNSILSNNNIQKTFFVKVVLPYKSNGSTILHFREVEVYDINGINVALNKPTSQSSTKTSTHISDNGVDGNLDNFFLTNNHDRYNSQGQWWEVDLQGGHLISKIMIYNRYGHWQNPLQAEIQLLSESREVLHSWTITNWQYEYTFNVPKLCN